ncbi:2-deoxy-D-gluconate 3-dehydrogenase [Subtercola sp. Z020]|uniref:SDR family oxidoreductase n=1 Tax=Subtercola sp. Z020 TaxID=2080582 RepID=UPI000CE8E697|nr:SDR family oxidoreductase [Subtercola sp. Z020]PPF81296.1 2-deoxy-D-gluconate 3-dehydrogenase [Subtercola sp. Z020]
MSITIDLSGQRALVTGARRGIGRAIAEELARAGADIIGVSAHLETEGSAVGAAVTALGRSFEGYSVDFSDREAVARFAGTITERPIDILVNAAGDISRSPAAEHPLSEWDRILEIDLSSQFVLTQQVGAQMLQRGSGRIVFIASLLSFQGGITVPGYAAAKSGIAGLTRALANEWTASGVTVNAIAPGYIATDNTTALRDDPQRSRDILARIPAGRWGEAADIAGAAVFLASPAAAYVSGTILAVDGGWLGR